MRFGLLSKILLPVLAVVLGIMISVCYSIVYKATEVMNESRQFAMRNLARNVGENTSSKISRTMSDLRLLASTTFTISLLQQPVASLVTGHGDARNASDLLMGMVFAKPDYVRIDLIHHTGLVLASSSPFAPTQSGLENSPCLSEALSSGQTMLSEPFYSNTAYDLLVAVCHPVPALPGQSTPGALVATLNTANLAANAVHDPLTDLPRSILLITGRGMILASLDPQETGSFKISRQSWYKTLPIAGNEGLATFHEDNRTYLAAYYRTPENWTALVILDQNQLYAQAGLIQTYSVAALILASLLLCGCVFWILRAVARDVRQLSEYANRASHGILQDSNPLMPREDELGDLSSSIGGMVNQLKEQVSAAESFNQELLAARTTIIQVVSSLVENRDPETGNHVRRTQTYVRLLAEQLRADHPQIWGFSNEQLDVVCSAAPLHDVGKVGISDAILFKPDRLTPEEFEIVKQHTVIGYTALSVTDNGEKGVVPILRMAAEIALTHHERWDGRGYPNALRGEQIPRSGRLMALADVYDALISHRVYKTPMPHSQTVKTISQESGTQFDPIVVAAFLKQCDTFRAIALQFADNDHERAAIML